MPRAEDLAPYVGRDEPLQQSGFQRRTLVLSLSSALLFGSIPVARFGPWREVAWALLLGTSASTA
jgi:hypothetical protein